MSIPLNIIAGSNSQLLSPLERRKRSIQNSDEIRPFAKHSLGVDKIPIITDNSHGIWRRIVVIDFLRTFSEEEMDRDLEGKLIREPSGIFNWALEGYRRLPQILHENLSTRTWVSRSESLLGEPSHREARKFLSPLEFTLSEVLPFP
jgi:hypothetical protein